MSTWVYMFDEFIPAFKLFETIKEAIVNRVKGVRNARVHNIYFNPDSLELFVRCLVKYELGEVSVKLIYSGNPVITFRNYYEYEKRN